MDLIKVLACPSWAYLWGKATAEALPANAIQGGHEYENTPLYIGRKLVDGCMQVGKVCIPPCISALYICGNSSTLNSDDCGYEIWHDDYEVLVRSPLALQLNI